MKQLVIDNNSVEVTEDDVTSFLARKIRDSVAEACDAVIVGDLGDIVAKHCLWTTLLPSVEPFYVVKCNDDAAVLSVLAQLGTGFVCYSKAEMQKVLRLGVPQSQILYAGPYRPSAQLQFAVQRGVELLTFESEAELRKLNSKHCSAKLILRINPYADGGNINDELAFGCQLNHVSRLLLLAKQLDAEVIGISMHIGDSQNTLSALCDAVVMARAIFDLAADIGFNLTVVDIGGDCVGKRSSEFYFEEFADVLRSSLEQSFVGRDEVRFIVECGQFFVESAFTVAVDVLDHRMEVHYMDNTAPDDAEACDTENASNVYYVSDGVYGSFSRILVDQTTVEPVVLDPSKFAGTERFVSSIWGPTYDSLDCLVGSCMLPRLNVGDWLAFRDMGAYLFNSSSEQLDGISNVERIYIMREARWLKLCLAAEDNCSRSFMRWSDSYKRQMTECERPAT